MDSLAQADQLKIESLENEVSELLQFKRKSINGQERDDRRDKAEKKLKTEIERLEGEVMDLEKEREELQAEKRTWMAGTKRAKDQQQEKEAAER